MKHIGPAACMTNIGYITTKLVVFTLGTLLDAILPSLSDRSLVCFCRSSKPTDSKGFGAPKAVQQAKQVSNEDKKWQLEAYETAEWLEWLEEQKKTANVKGDHVFVQIQLDGTVRSSGLGSPPWEKFVSDLAPLDDLRTRFTDGMGRSQ